MRTRLAGTLLVALPALAQTGFPGMNPAMMLGPGMANPLGMVAPLGMATPMTAGLLYPGMQMAPNLLSHQHLQYMANPYLGGPAAGNPYLPNHFAPPSFAPGRPFGGVHSQPVLPFPSFIPLSTGPMMNPFPSPGPGPLLGPPRR